MSQIRHFQKHNNISFLTAGEKMKKRFLYLNKLTSCEHLIMLPLDSVSNCVWHTMEDVHMQLGPLRHSTNWQEVDQ
jgi:hypothetical protein